MYLIFFIGVLLWLIYGLLIKDAVVIIANLVTLILSGIVLVLKIREK
jgi:MtN3 and saliva related transmembrane protein